MLPTAQAYGNDTVFAIDETGNVFTPRNFTNLLAEVNAAITYEMLEDMESFREFHAPGVPMNCIYGKETSFSVILPGYNVTTIKLANFSAGFEAPYQNITMDGDGTCGRPSLEVCSQWIQQQEEPVTLFPVANMCHACAMFNTQAISVFLKVLGL